MRTAGIIGGLGPESTIDYYRSIIARYRARTMDAGYPQIVINSLDVDRGIALLDAGRLDELADYLTAGVELLARAGVDFGRSRQIPPIWCSMRSSDGRVFPLSVSCAQPVIMRRPLV